MSTRWITCQIPQAFESTESSHVRRLILHYITVGEQKVMLRNLSASYCQEASIQRWRIAWAMLLFCSREVKAGCLISHLWVLVRDFRLHRVKKGLRNGGAEALLHDQAYSFHQCFYVQKC